ncbi:putative pentatricopeptide repeat-containing protein [Tripterygium wilfordii]|uniref:Putative pentatricopeptide repeat-containing protein n=1 Tax=Tripterygium wilfordii TaxID=458696 RepID=A0A7J7C3C0_TRIWF|nr:putative pentatricopeptide repeat-containing protein At1g53330 [Tripterygium wilfordii]KAF5728256.1 putative pentatricopeptide repeat-containing protein [Tripterygium wilfordii]
MAAVKPISPFRLSSLLRLQKDPNIALQLFQNPNPTTQRSKPFRYTLLSYDLIISKLGRAKMLDEIEQILLQLKQDTRIIPKEIIFCNVITYYGRARLPSRALQLFEEMPSFRCERTIKSVNSLLNAFLKCRDFDKMREFFVGIGKYARPDTCSYNILIHSCCVRGSVDHAWELFDEMLKRGLCPNLVTFGTLIYGLCSSLRTKEAFKLKEDMVRVYGIWPNAHVYASLIKGLCGVGELSAALTCKEEMVKTKMKLDSAIYSTLIDGLLKVGRKNEAFGLLEEMESNGCKPDTVTFNVMINWHCKNNDFEAAYRVLDEMADKGCRPDVISYNVIIGGLCRDEKISEANDLFDDMRRRGCVPDVLSYRILFDGFCNGKQFKEAAFILDEMLFHGYAPRCASLHKFINGLCDEGNSELLWTVLNSLGQGNAIDSDSWGMAISLFCNGDKLPAKLVDALSTT